MSEDKPKKRLFARLYDWVIGLSAKKSAVWVLCGVSFAESSFFPIPPDPILMAMSLARPKRALLFALYCTIASVLGGMLGYALGYFLFSEIVHPVMNAIGISSAWLGNTGIRVCVENIDAMIASGVVEESSRESLRSFLDAISGQLSSWPILTDGLFFKGIMFFHNYGVLTVFVAAFSILPYKLFTISAGLFGQPLLGFVIASFAGRGLRFFAVAALFYFFGPKVEPWIRRNLEALIILFTLLIVIGILLLKLL